MNGKLIKLLSLIAAIPAPVSALAQGTAFTYQGSLTQSGGPADGFYDLRFSLYGVPTDGLSIAAPVALAPVPVSNGLFTVSVDFGSAAFDGSARWLEIAVRTNDNSFPFVTLSPRQPIMAVPYALLARSVASNAIAAGSIQNGVITDSKIADDQVVKSLNGLRDDVTLLPGNNVTFELLGNTLEIASTAWGLFGNGGTVPVTHFLGTTDNQPLLFKVNNTRVMRLELNGLSPNVIGGFALNNATPGVVGATIGGGGGYISAPNSARADYATISGGSGHSAGGFASLIGGGENNNIGSNANHAVVGGGVRNVVEPDAVGAAIAGGENNVVRRSARDTAIGGGFGNSALMNSIMNVIAGGQGNLISSNVQHSAIGGGHNNTLSAGATYVAIGGGQGNTIENLFNGTIGGGAANTIARGADYATIGGGLLNRIETNASRATIAGGDNNDIEFGALRATIGGGLNNTIERGGSQSVIGGGGYNHIKADAFYTTIAGGDRNTIEEGATYAAVAGGSVNTVQSGARYTHIGGGYSNKIGTNATHSNIGGGQENEIGSDAHHSTIGGGELHDIAANAQHCAVGGGLNNNVLTTARYSTISGGAHNTIQAGVSYGTIAGGGTWIDGDPDEGNVVSDHYCTISGGAGNWSGNPFQPLSGRIYATVGGGHLNWATTPYSSIGGGVANSIQTGGACGFIGGGTNNGVVGGFGVVSGGRDNMVWAEHGVVGGGSGNDARGTNSVIAGGRNNSSRGNASAIGGGAGNRVEGYYSTVPGGVLNTIESDYSFAAGHFAEIQQQHSGCFLFADHQSGTWPVDRLNFPSENTNEFAVRATGGVRFVTGWDLTFGPTDGVKLPPGGSSWMNLSDRNSKSNCVPVDARDVLEKVALLSIATWNYKSQAQSIHHIGPMAQDFHDAFQVGEDDKHITSVDADGVALAAIQGLHQMVKEKDAEIQELKGRLEKLERLLESQQVR